MPDDPLFDRLARALEGRYTLTRELGRGGMGVVYLATDVQLGREVAIKALPESTRQYIGGEGFQRELHLAARLSHPHIVPVFEAGEADGILFYAMAYVPGETLADRIQREGALPLDEAIRLAAEVGDALQCAHEQGIIHRDIKPSNIVLSRGHALVLDFGIAKVMHGDGDTGTTLTATGVVKGTAAYMSPEQAAGEKRLDPRTDIYALAATLYEMLSGEPPFTGPSMQAIVARVIADPPRPLRTIRPDIPPHIERTLAAALAKNPADRPRMAREFVELLTHPTSERPARRLRLLWPVVGGAAVVGLVALWLMLAGEPREPAVPAGPPAGMVVIPGGEYDVGGPVGRVTPRPLRRVLLDSFYLDVTEVTIADYARFLGARAGRVPWRAVADSQWPVTGVLWTEADAYCRWTDAAGRLPTEDEWEAAARGAQSRRFPWGAAMERFRANVDAALDTLVAVGSFPRGASPFGVVDLVGNAWEWTATADTARNGTVRHIIKGGAFNSLPEVAQPAFRIAYPDTLALVYNTGFRCARPVRR